MENQMHHIWCVQKDKFKWFPLRFYFYLSGNKNLKRIFFGDYMNKIHDILWIKGREPMVQKQDFQRLSFDLIDKDQDGVITSTDLVFCTNYLEPNCKFLKKEIEPLITHYDQTHISLYGIPKSHDALVFDKYREFLMERNSYIVEEMRERLLIMYPM